MKRILHSFVLLLLAVFVQNVYADDSADVIQGYFRVQNGYGWTGNNLGQTKNNGNGYVQVTDFIWAAPNQTAEQVKTEAGSIIYVYAKKVTDPKDPDYGSYKILNMRSQGVEVIGGDSTKRPTWDEKFMQAVNTSDYGSTFRNFSSIGYWNSFRAIVENMFWLVAQRLDTYWSYPPVDFSGNSIQDYKMRTAATEVTKAFNDTIAEAIDIDCYLTPTKLSNGQPAYLFYCKTFNMDKVVAFYKKHKTQFDYAFGEMRAVLRAHKIFTGETISNLEGDDVTGAFNEFDKMREFGYDLDTTKYASRITDINGHHIGDADYSGDYYVDIPYEEIFSDPEYLFYWLKLYAYKIVKYGDKYADALEGTSVASYGEMLRQISNVFNSYAPFERYYARIHYDTPYYLIDGVVSNGETGNAGSTYYNKGMFGVANNNKTSGFGPEVETAHDGSRWVITKVDGGDNYFGLKASDKFQGLDGHYYTTLYVDFPIDVAASQTASPGMHFYTIGAAHKGTTTDAQGNTVTYNYADVTEQTGKIKEGTPLVVECTSTKPADNKVVPAQDVALSDRDFIYNPVTFEGLMQGTYFSLGKSQYTDADNTTADGYGKKIENALDSHIFGCDVTSSDQASLLTALQKRGGFSLGVNNAVLYTLQKDAGDKHNPMGFYKYTGKTLAKNKCFLLNPTISATSGAKIYIGDPFSETNGISNVENNAEKRADVIYDLQGRRVNHVQASGLYIVNGKKVMIL